MKIIEQLETYAPLILRVGLASVFLYFGVSQLIRPEAFVGWLPAEAGLVPLTPRTLIVLNGAFETLFGTFLVLGLFTRISAFLLGGHLLMITFSIGLTEIGVRDFGLSIATLALACFKVAPLSLDAFFEKQLAGERMRTTSESQEEYPEEYPEQHQS
ncbi:DoxX family protein [Candidatus Woesearchaeota archaeon]|nr:MAG: DoxX family protein [Candidatus Woesearchaeota archaeon]